MLFVLKSSFLKVSRGSRRRQTLLVGFVSSLLIASVAVVGTTNAASANVVYQFEKLAPTASAGDDVVQAQTSCPQGTCMIFNANAVGDSLVYSVNVPEARAYAVKVGVKKSNSRGIFQVAIKGAPNAQYDGRYVNHGAAQDLYSADVAYRELSIANVTFGSAGTKQVRFSITGKNASSIGYSLGLDYIKFVPLGTTTTTPPTTAKPTTTTTKPPTTTPPTMVKPTTTTTTKSTTTTAKPPAPTPSTGKPGASNTGVPDGTALTVHNGDITVTQDGTVIDSLDVRGKILVKADNVTIRRSLIRGGAASSGNNVLIASWWGNTNLRVEDSTLRADYPSIYVDGISGSNFTATRLDISRVVDPVKVVDGNVTVTGSWLHQNAHFEPDPTHPDGKTHDDSIQVEGGKNTLISGNTLEDSHNAAIMVTQNHSQTANLTIANNWLQDGACTINVTQLGLGSPIQGMVIKNNRFGPGQYGTTCPMRLPSASPITLQANVWDATSQAALPVRF